MILFTYVCVCADNPVTVYWFTKQSVGVLNFKQQLGCSKDVTENVGFTHIPTTRIFSPYFLGESALVYATQSFCSEV